MTKNALVLEDQKSIRDLVGRTLTESGFDTRAYGSPVEIDAVEDEPPFVIVSDNHMPHVTGLQYVRELRSRGQGRQHIAIMSGNWNCRDLEEAESLGCKVFKKPFAMADLAKWVKSLSHSE